MNKFTDSSVSLLGVVFIIIISVIVSIIPIDSFGYSFVGVTTNGVEFPILSPDVLDYSNDSNNGTSILDGLGVYLTIQNIGTNGMVYFGSTDEPGEQTDLRAYVEVGNNDDWVIAITDDDYSEVLSVPEFGVEYQYVSGSLIKVIPHHLDEGFTSKSANIR